MVRPLKLILALALLLRSGQAFDPASAAPTVEIDGAPVTVFSYTERCELLDLPDTPLRAFRRTDGAVVAFATHYLNRGLVGSSLSKLAHDCKLVYQGGHLSDPAKFDDRTWISATWTSDGVHVVALGHNEYHADQFASGCQFHIRSECWYDSIVPLVSANGGRTFHRENYPEPIAALPMQRDAEVGGPRGYHDPSNIVFSEGHYYALIARSGYDGKRTGRCLFRTDTVMVADAWTVWNGSSFSPIFGSPFNRDWVSRPPCEAATGLPGALGSIAKVKDTNIFAAFAIAESTDDLEGGYVNVAFSSDLLHWTDTRHLLNATPTWAKACPNGEGYNYAAVLSDTDTGGNFDTIGGASWLFITKIPCLHPLDRELIRYHVMIKSNAGVGR